MKRHTPYLYSFFLVKCFILILSVDKIKIKYLLLCLTIFHYEAAAQIRWPHGRTSAIVLTYDDALASQATSALVQLKKAHLPATFFLTGYLRYQDIDIWRNAAKSGYELANHTIFHPCTAEPGNSVAAENYSVGTMLREIKIMNTFLTAIDGRSGHSFAYPCFDTLAGGKSYIDSLQYSKIVKYARLGGEDSVIITSLSGLNFFRVPAYDPDPGITGNELIAFVKMCSKEAGSASLYFTALRVIILRFHQKHTPNCWPI